MADPWRGFAVSEEFANANGGLTTLSELGALGQPLVLAAGEECAERPFCQPGLETTYGLNVTEILPLGFSTPQVKEAVAGGEAQLGLVATTDGTLESFGLILLEDDKSLQLADNLVPIVNSETASDDAIALIHQASRGKPRSVNRLAISALIAACAAGKNLVDETSARSAVTENHDPPSATP